MKKITLLYEASVLANAGKNVSRSGIYFVAYNVLKQLSKNDNLNIVLYIPRHKIRYIKKDGFLSQFPFIVSYSKPKFKENIEIHKSNMKQIFNLDKKIIYILKILKNYLCLFSQMFNNHKKRNERLLQSINIFFSPFFAPNDEINHFNNILHFIILHDIIPLLYPENYPNIEKEDHWYRKLVSTLNKKAYYFCISECTKHDFFKRFPGKLDEEKMIVALNATAQNFYPKYDLKKTFAVFSKYGVEFKPNNKYLFSFCMLDPRKNLYFTLKCYILFIKKHKINDLYFYLGGTETIPFFERLEEAVSDFNEYRDKIAFLGYVDDADVNILYSNALFFTYISQYEGFGMPPLEAMQAGVPVITSNNSSLPEVVGDAAITIDYDSEEQCIKAFEDLYFNEDLRKSCIQKGLERAKLFSWEKTAKIISDTMLTAVEKND